MPVTQFNMKWVEPAGLVKFDFLGLKTLTVLDVAVKLLKQRNVHVDLPTLPLDDAKSYQMLARGDVVGVFQVESQGCGARWSTCGPTVSRTSSRWWRCIVPARWRIFRPIAPEAWRRGAGIPSPDARADTEGDLRRHHLSGAGDADRAGHGRLFARRCRPAAAGDGQEDPRGDGEAGRDFRRRGAVKNGVPKGQAETIFELLRSSPTTASTRAMPPLTRWCLPHRLYEGALPG